MNEIIHVTRHSGKMEGIPSVSTSCLCNPYCMRRRTDPRTICSHCYSVAYQKLRRGLREAMERNTELLCSHLLPDEAFPRFTERFARIESFGDAKCVTQVRNYIRMCRLNPKTRFAAWTKNLGFWRSAIRMDGKPDNLVLVYSSPFVGVTARLEDGDRAIVDHVFTVLPRSATDAEVNCGARSCRTCLRCYRKSTAVNVYERLK